MPCYCDQCSVVPRLSYTEEYRHQKEVEHCAKQDGAWIRQYLDGIEQKRGIEARMRLRNDILEIWGK